MKIKALNIAAFGGIKNLQLNLDNGFNVIYGDNENGKTTVMSFIKMMFYGTERGSAQLSKNLRKKYTPWDGSAMAGSIDFEAQNRLYRIERIFGNSNSTDKVTLIDLDLGTREAAPSDIGVKLLGLSSAAFERSVFIGQFGFPESNALAEGELNSKLSNITLTGDESISFDTVNARLQNAKYALMSKSGRAGEYDKNVKKYSELEQALQIANEKQSQIKAAKQKTDLALRDIDALQIKADKLKAQIDREQDYRNADKLKELLSLKARLDELNETLRLENGQLVDEMFVRKVDFCLSKIEGINQKITAKASEQKILEDNLDLALNPSPDVTPEKAEKLKQKIDTLEKELQQITEKITALEQKDNMPKSRSYIIWYVLALVFDILSVFLFSVNKILFGISCGLAFVFLILAVVLMLKTKANAQKQKNEIVDLKLKETKLVSLIATEKSNLTVINTALNTNASMIEKQKELLEQTKQQLYLLENEVKAESDILFQLFARFKKITDITEIKNELNELREKAAAQKELKQNINYILKDVGNISYEEAKAKLDKMAISPDTSTDFELVKAEYEESLKAITDRKTTVAAILAEVKALSSSLTSPDALKKQLDALAHKIADQKEYCDALDIALSVLSESFIEVRRSYGSALEKQASDIFKGITDGKYQNMSISKSFDIAVEKADVFGSRELDYLSSGTADQAYLSLRLALSELIAQNSEPLPVLLDDALAQYDDKRTETAIKFLKEYSQNGQIIMFTCHKSVFDCAKKFEAKDITL